MPGRVIEQRLAALGCVLPKIDGNGARLAPAVRTGNVVYVSGFSSEIHGRLGEDLSIERGQEAARQCIISCLAEVRWLIGDLDRISRVIKLLGWVNCTPGFSQHPAVINGATELILSAFGREKGWHARSAVGSPQLDEGAAVEIEAIFEIDA